VALVVTAALLRTPAPQVVELVDDRGPEAVAEAA